ncbi:MAG: MOSC domain-containing protein, partial [Saprospiraceae bacterium]
NLVVEDTLPFEEDAWGSIQIGDTPFDVVKPCARCPVPTTDQETGQRSPEPLKTLAGFRKSNNKVYFGQNAIWTGSGMQTIQIGSEIKIV